MVTSQAYISLPRPPLQCSVNTSSLRFASTTASSSASSSKPSNRRALRRSSVSLPQHRPFRVRSGPDTGGLGDSPSTVSSQNPAPLRTSSNVRRTRFPEDDLKTVFVEDENVSVEGVAKVDRSDVSNDSGSGRVAFLVGGDIIALLAFAAIGRMSHSMPVFDVDSVKTADPFIAGWLLGAYLLGGYGRDGQGSNGSSKAIFSALKSWAVGIPLGLVIRGFTSGHVPPQPFIVVSMASTLVLLVGWRTAATLVFPYEKKKIGGNKQGSVFELFQLLSSLVRRW